PSVFERLLDVDIGGTFAFLPESDTFETRMEYVVNTNVLRTEVSCRDGRFEIFDYAPRIPAGLDAEAPLEIHRLILPREGAARVRVLFDPKPDYARVQKPKIVPVDGGLEIGDEPAHLHLCTNIPLPSLDSGQALRLVGHLAEGEASVSFLRDVAEAGALQPVYGIGGERELTEHHLDHLAGYGGSKPVRIGNAAYIQRQHDLMGEMILCLDTITADPRVVFDEHDSILRLVERFVSEAIAAVETDDTGLWEYRTFPNKYTFSHVLCWVAASRGAKLARRFGHESWAAKWEAWANDYREVILDRAYNTDLGFFAQTLDGRFPDASNLLLPTLGLIDPKDPRFVSTVDAYERLLVENGLMLRYRHKDDFGDTTSAFSICSFWWAEALAMIGRIDEATALFYRLVGYANKVGLFSEDIEPKTGRLLG